MAPPHKRAKAGDDNDADGDGGDDDDDDDDDDDAPAVSARKRQKKRPNSGGGDDGDNQHVCGVCHKACTNLRALQIHAGSHSMSERAVHGLIWATSASRALNVNDKKIASDYWADKSAAPVASGSVATTTSAAAAAVAVSAADVDDDDDDEMDSAAPPLKKDELTPKYMVLAGWFAHSRCHPSDADKAALAAKTTLTVEQIDAWFVDALRLKK